MKRIILCEGKTHAKIKSIPWEKIQDAAAVYGKLETL